MSFVARIVQSLLALYGLGNRPGFRRRAAIQRIGHRWGDRRA